MSNEQMLQHRLSADAAMPTAFAGIYGTMKARNFSSTPSDLDDDSNAPTPPKLRISNRSSINLTAAVAGLTTAASPLINGHNNPNDDDDDGSGGIGGGAGGSCGVINRTSSSSLLNSTTVKQYADRNGPILNTASDADEDDSHLSAKSAIKAAFVQQQKDFLMQQQLQQQHHHQQQQQAHLHLNANATHHHQQQAAPPQPPPPPHLQHLYDDEHSFDQQYQRSLQYPDIAYLHEAENNGSRQRKERMSKRQKELYVEFLEQNPIVNTHRRNDPVLDGFWLRLANILNDCPNGAAKSVAEWKQAFDNWRYRVFLYARHNSQLNGDDAINSKAFKPLTLTDKRAYNLWIRNPDTAPANTEKLPTDLNCSED